MSDPGLVNPVRMPTTNGEMAVYGDDSKLLVTFSSDAVYQQFESEGGIVGDRVVYLESGMQIVPGHPVPGAGRPIYKDVDFIEIVQPGSKNTIKRMVKLEDDQRGPSDPNRFPRQWAAYKAQKQQVSDGLPVEQWAPLTKSHVLMLKSAQIFTVEQLAAVSDANLSQIGIMDGRKFRDMAISYLQSAKSSAPLTSLTSQVQILMAQNEDLLRQIHELGAGVAPKPKRGRPRKENPSNDPS